MSEEHVREVETYLHVGAGVAFQPNASQAWQPRYRTFIRGWERSVHIILDRPKHENRFVPLCERMSCIIRFLQEDVACAFQSTVLDSTGWQDGNWFSIAWPETIHVVSFRKYKRTAVNIECALSRDGAALGQGEICDISKGGCAIRTTLPLVFGATIGVSFALPDGVPIQDAQAVVRNVRPLEDGSRLIGCEFAPGQEHFQNDIAVFESAALQRKQEQSPCQKRLLLLDDDIAVITAFQRDFKERGYDVVTASNLVDGFFRLCLLRPAAALVSARYASMPASDIVRLIRTHEPLTSVPLFVHGLPDQPAAGEETAAPQVDHCFTERQTVPEICDAVLARIQPEPACAK